MLGFHVHEKASLMALVPLTLGALESARDAELYLVLSATAHVSLFPLLPGPGAAATKATLTAAHFCAALAVLDAFHRAAQRRQRIRSDGVAMGAGSRLCLVLVALAWGYDAFVHRALAGERLPFLPLLLYSTACALAMLRAWWLSLCTLRRKHLALRQCMPDAAFAGRSAWFL
jgi:alpha-1,3-glucosyltransferase